MTIMIERENSIFFNTKAFLIDESKDVASNWASEHIVANQGIKWILAKYVEADNANSNGQYWSLDDLRIKFPTINHGPMNIDHQINNIVGTWTASELLYPMDGAAIMNPYVEVLGAFWKLYFPNELADVEKAFNAGQLYTSMECFGESVTCVGSDDACGETFPYSGPFSDKYCAHIKDRASYRQINNPHFVGGALIIPPNKPGWKSASVNELSQLIDEKKKEALMTAIAEENPEGDEESWFTDLLAITYRANLDRFTRVK